MIYALLLLVLFNVEEIHAQSVKDVCTDARILSEAKDANEVLSRFPDSRACATGQDAEVDKHSADVVSIVMRTLQDIKTHTGNQSPSMELLIGAVKNQDIFKPLDTLAAIIEADQMKKTPPSVQEVKDLNLIGKSFSDLAKEYEKRPDQEKLKELKVLEKKYVEATKAVMRKTTEGRKALDCYENPSAAIKKRLPGGKMPQVRLTPVLLFEEGRPRESQIGGSFSSSCTHIDPPQFKTEISLNPDTLKPMQMAYEMTHEMSHACDTIEIGNASLQVKEAQEERIPKDKLGKYAAYIEGLEIQNVSQLGPIMRNFSNWMKHPAPVNSNAPKNPSIVKFEAIKKKMEEDKITPEELESFVSTLQNDPEISGPREKAEKISAFTLALAEVKAFKAALQMFKELALLDPSYCGITDAGATFYGPVLFSPADFFRTLEEKDLTSEIMKIYSLKSGTIPQKYIYQMDPGKGGSIADQVKRDAQGNPLLNPEFKNFLNAQK